MDEFYAICDRHEEGEKRWDLRFGIVASAAFNPHRGKDGKAIRPGEWFGHAEPTPEMTDEQMLLTMQQLAVSHNARLKK